MAWLFGGSVAHAILPEPMRAVMASREFAEDKISVSVYDVTAGKSLLNHLPDAPRNPASVAKLVTTGAAMDLLGTSHRFLTELRSYGEIKDGVLDGHLIIRGQGNFSMEYADLTQVVTQLNQLGVKRITGNILVDNTYFSLRDENTEPLDENIFSGYNAIPTATMVDDQLLTIYIESKSGKITARTEPEMPAIQIHNELKATNAKCSQSRYSYEPTVSSGTVSVRLWGSFSAKCGRTRLSRLGIPSSWLFGQIFKSAWLAGDNQLDGNVLSVLDGNFSLRAPLLTAHESVPLGELIGEINKLSNNPKARSLFLSIGSLHDALPASAADSRHVIGEWFSSFLSHPPALQFLDNGSGLSRETAITASDLNAMLVYLAGKPYFQTYRDSMPIMGVDGTLSKRMHGTPLEGQAWMKTGSIRGVKALAGYMISQEGHLLAVSILHEDAQVSVVSANPAHEALLSWLYESY